MDPGAGHNLGQAVAARTSAPLQPLHGCIGGRAPRSGHIEVSLDRSLGPKATGGATCRIAADSNGCATGDAIGSITAFAKGRAAGYAMGHKASRHLGPRPTGNAMGRSQRPTRRRSYCPRGCRGARRTRTICVKCQKETGWNGAQSSDGLYQPDIEIRCGRTAASLHQTPLGTDVPDLAGRSPEPIVGPGNGT